MGALDDSGFVVQTVKNGKVETSRIGFEKVKSVWNLSEESLSKSPGPEDYHGGACGGSRGGL